MPARSAIPPSPVPSPPAATAADRMTSDLEAADLDAVESLLDDHRYRDAWQRAKSLGDPRRWRGARARLLAARLATHLGAQHLGETLRLLAGREHPEDLDACLARIGARTGRVGVHRTWLDLEALRPRLDQADDESRATWWMHRAGIASGVRDFDAAWRACEAAIQLLPEPWIRLLPSQIMEAEDRLDEAQAHVDQILREHPGDRLAVQLYAHLLRQRGRELDAFDFLVEAVGRVDYPLIHLQLAQMDMDAQRWNQAEEKVRRFISRAPALSLDRRARRAITHMRAMLLARLGRRLDAADLIEQVSPRWGKKLVERLRDPQLEDRRVVLEVPWVRQHHDTCSPATLTAICRFWQCPAEHLEIAEQICYGGTRSHSERRWARENGLVGREFTVDWESATALIDRGVPFTLVTSDAVNAHLQAVVGYDVRQRTFICRDPSSRNLTEYDADDLLEKLAATGPRGMVLLPPAEAGRLEDPQGVELALPDAALYDLYDQVEGHLERHQRGPAREVAERITAATPGHRLEKLARAALAAYDRDVPRLLGVVEEQLEQYPDDDRLQLQRLGLLADLERPTQWRTAVEAQAERLRSDPSFRVLLATELLRDAGRWTQAERLLASVVRDRPSQADAFDQLAQLAWLRGERNEARRLFRWAACLAEVVETYQAHFLMAARETDRADEALDFLGRRFERFGNRSSRPAQTLALALEMLDRDDEATAVLEQAAETHPDDGELALHRVGHLAQRNRLDEARDLLGRFEGRSNPSAWLERRAELAEIEGDLDAALDAERKICEKEPTAAERHQRVARLLALTEGRQAALEHLRTTCETYPHHVALAELRAQWAREEGPETVVEVVEPLLQLMPDNAWAWRELAGARLELGDTDAASRATARAAELEPGAPPLENLLARLAEEAGRTDEALEHYRRAIELEPDNVWAIVRLPQACHGAEARREALRWIADQIARSTTGEAAPILHEQLARYLPPDEVESILRKLLDCRDLWPVRRALIAQVAQRGRLEEAGRLAQDAVDRYPFQTELRLLAAKIHHGAGRSEDERQELEAILALDPRNGEARTSLARLHLAEGRRAEARQECEIARARNPFDAEPLLVMADLRWADGDSAGTLDMLEKALELEPDRDDLWASFQGLARSVGQSQRPEALARRLLESRRRDAFAWATLARVAVERSPALEAIDTAIAIAPRAVQLHATKAQILAAHGDLSAAYAACRVDIPGLDRPVELILQEAEILAADQKLDRAVEVARRAVDEDPTFRMGWQRISDWALDSEDWSLALEATDAWTALAPLDPVALGHRGAALRGSGRIDEAVRCLRSALDLEATYAYAAFQLAELLTERGEGREALKLFSVCADASTSGAVLAKAATLAAGHGGHVHAGRWIQGMALDAETPPGLLHELLDVIEEGNHHYLKLFDKAALGPDARAPLAAVRLSRLAEQRGFNAAWDHLIPLYDASEAWGEAAVALLDLESKKWPQHSVHRAKKHLHQLRTPSRSWSYLGFLFARAGNWKQAISVLESYRDRELVEVWDLNCLVISLRQLQRFQEACDVARDALDLPESPVHAELRVWVALWDALNDRPEAARALPESIEVELDRDSLFLFRMAKALAACAGRVGDDEAYESARLWLRGSIPPLRCANPTERKLYDRVARKIARARGGLWARLWAECHLPR